MRVHFGRFGAASAPFVVVQPSLVFLAGEWLCAVGSFEVRVSCAPNSRMGRKSKALYQSVMLCNDM